MSRYLLVDIGAGTMDVLYYDTRAALHYKAVVKSPVRRVAEKAAALSGSLLVTGCEMGGGPVADILRQKAQSAAVVMSASAAATLHHDAARVRSWGIKIIEDATAAALEGDQKYSKLVLADLDAERLRKIVTGFGVPFAFDAVAVCAQDHGVPPAGVSHLDFRHSMFTARLDDCPWPHTLLYAADEVPAAMNRLASIAAGAAGLPAAEVYVMDSGMAAVLGASMDPAAQRAERKLLLDVATSHTVAAVMVGDAIAGFFEYHSRDITLPRLETLLRDLSDGNLAHRQVLAEGGHGAYLRCAVGFENIDVIVATGPGRRLVEKSSLPIVFGAPLGDNMMTGTVGLLEALRRRKKLAPLPYR